MDGTGAPLRHEELAFRKGKSKDGKAQTHEVKVAAIFTEHPRPGQEPWRDLDSTTYVATDQRCQAFGTMVRAEYFRRFKNVPETIVIGDAADWIRNAADINFPGVLRIVDWHHGAQHVASLAELVHPRNSPAWSRLRKKWTGKLWNGKIDALVSAARRAFPKYKAKEGEKALDYFIKNRQAMRYDLFRAQGLFIGSGVVEAACKTLVGQRFKCSGMHWSQQGLSHLFIHQNRNLLQPLRRLLVLANAPRQSRLIKNPSCTPPRKVLHHFLLTAPGLLLSSGFAPKRTKDPGIGADQHRLRGFSPIGGDGLSRRLAPCSSVGRARPW